MTSWTAAYQAPPSLRFSRQEYWGGLPFPSPGDLPNPGIKPGSPALQADALPSEPPGKSCEGDGITRSVLAVLPPLNVYAESFVLVFSELKLCLCAYLHVCGFHSSALRTRTQIPVSTEFKLRKGLHTHVLSIYMIQRQWL